MTSSTPHSLPPAKSSLATLKGLLPFLAPYKQRFALAGLALLVAAGATLAIPYAFKQMIDLGFGSARNSSPHHVDIYFLALFAVACVLAVATSVLDAESERLVQSALEAAMAGRTTLVIAHRLATVQRADRIIVMEEGRIVETGTHVSLVERGGLYASLAALQFHSVG